MPRALLRHPWRYADGACVLRWSARVRVCAARHHAGRPPAASTAPERGVTRGAGGDRRTLQLGHAAEPRGPDYNALSGVSTTHDRNRAWSVTPLGRYPDTGVLAAQDCTTSAPEPSILSARKSMVSVLGARTGSEIGVPCVQAPMIFSERLIETLPRGLENRERREVGDRRRVTSQELSVANGRL